MYCAVNYSANTDDSPRIFAALYRKGKDVRNYKKYLTFFFYYFPSLSVLLDGAKIGEQQSSADHRTKSACINSVIFVWCCNWNLKFDF